MATVVTVKRRAIGTIVQNNGIKMGAEFRGIPWNSNKFHGIPKNSTEFHGILWKMGVFYAAEFRYEIRVS